MIDCAGRQIGFCRRCGGTFPTCCSCPDDSHWNKTLPTAAANVVTVVPTFTVNDNTGAARAFPITIPFNTK